jgi:hypothetical protein
MKRFSIKGKRGAVHIVKVDEPDAYLLRSYVFTIGGSPAAPTAVRCVQGGVVIPLSHFVKPPPSGMRVLHMNGDTLDNRAANLLICTWEQWGNYFQACGNDGRIAKRTGEPCRERRDQALRLIIESNKEAA